MISTYKLLFVAVALLQAIIVVGENVRRRAENHELIDVVSVSNQFVMVTLQWVSQLSFY